MKKTTYKTLPVLGLTFQDSGMEKSIIRSSRDSVDVIRKFYHEDINIYESFFMLLLNRANKTIGYVKISQGGQSGTVVDVKIVAKYAIESLAASVIVAHNHPSGNTKPSLADIEITRKIKDGLKLLDISLLDHIILTDDNYHSFADAGQL